MQVSVAAPSQRRVLPVAGAFAGLAGLSAYVYARNPLEADVFPPCPFNALTGGWCPGCGATRASYLLMRGDVVEALHYNALWVVLAPVVVWQLVAVGVELATGRRLPRMRMTRGLAAGLIAAIVLFFAVRNLPFAAFDALNPPTPT